MTKKLLYLLFVLPLILASCGDDETGSVGLTYKNVNANTAEKSEHATRLEVPKVAQGNNYLLLVKESADIGVNYMIEWDCIKRAQRWTCYSWTKANSIKGWNRDRWKSGEKFNGYGGNGDPFQPDKEIPETYRTELSDYSNSGYNRGHMCASEDRIVSKEVNGQTFYLSNMHPQIGGHNSGIWSTLEAKLRGWRDATVGVGGEMYVCKGGTIDDVNINGKKMSGVVSNTNLRMPVPKYFFMAILKKSSSGVYSGVALWTEHKSYSSSEYKDVSAFMISIDELETRTGFDFFCNLPDNLEASVESNLVTSEWK